MRVVAGLATNPAAPTPDDAVVARPIQMGSRTVPRGHYAKILEAGPTDCLVRVAGMEGRVERASLSFDGQRHLVHLTTTGAAPTEWWVATPDGGGLIWRCHWIPLGQRGYLNDWHDEWLDLVRPALAASEHAMARPRTVRDPLEAGVNFELFFAPPWGGRRALVSFLESPRPLLDAEVRRSEATAVTDEGTVVAIGQGSPLVWALPGGRREAGESLEATLGREVAEEACARVVDHHLLGYQRFAFLAGDPVARIRTDAMFWARVVLDPFRPRFGTTERRLMSVSDALVEPMWCHPIAARLFTLADQIEAQRRA